ncbi:MAG: SGNH/GDSL hydrolase family protein [Bacteroidota bacterium]
MRPVVVFFSFIIVSTILMSFQQKNNSLEYLPLGDSYTICTGAEENDSWPLLLTRHLNENKISTKLLVNPARNGYSTQDLINYELPLLKKLNPGFVTILIGVNDWVRGVPAPVFKKNLVYILDEVQKSVPGKKNIILISIPDFGVTPQGKSYGGGRNISAGISEFNAIIRTEAKNRGLALVDIFGVSKQMEKDVTLVAADGLHPSAKEYAVWEKMILAESLKLLK